MIRLILTLLTFTLMALPAAAQDEPRGPSFELFGGAGAIYSSSSGLSLHTETVGARGGFSLTRVWTVEAALSRTSGDPVTWNGEISAKAYLFQGERVRLFALAGPGVRREDLSRGSADAATVHAGIGVEIDLSPRFYLRPELRSRWPTSHLDERHRSEDLTMGFGWRF
ncbi:MAG TPA: outer membrane beta-barrel protein [Thermoanaerobaculia bacterium]|nr:outer membrane beta-barrel protein [Thermoanaerobaculia bacterium]